MPHNRLRYLNKLLVERLKYSPIVGVLGHRQVGKTTLVSSLSKEYASLDRAPLLNAARLQPESFLENRAKPFAIDECQLAPELFPELKEKVRTSKQSGQFILTGSVRFTSRKAIRESLTGRIINLELLPMTLAEMNQAPLPNTLPQIMKSGFSHFKGVVLSPSKIKAIQNELQRYCISGGLPGIAFTRKNEIRASQFDSHLETVLIRDLPLVMATKLDSVRLYQILRILARNQGRPTRIADLQRECRVARPTLVNLIQALEALFLLRILPTDGGPKASSFFFEDVGLATHLAGEPLGDEVNLIRCLYANLREQFHYRPELNGEFFVYRKHSGASVPLAVRSKQGILGIIPTIDLHASRSNLLCAQSFLKAYPAAKVVIAHSGTTAEALTSQIAALPWPALL